MSLSSLFAAGTAAAASDEAAVICVLASWRCSEATSAAAEFAAAAVAVEDIAQREGTRSSRSGWDLSVSVELKGQKKCGGLTERMRNAEAATFFLALLLFFGLSHRRECTAAPRKGAH